MKIKIQFKINGNIKQFNLFLTIYDIIIQIKSYIFIFCTFTNSCGLEHVWISFHVIISKPFNQIQAVLSNIWNKFWKHTVRCRHCIVTCVVVQLNVLITWKISLINTYE